MNWRPGYLLTAALIVTLAFITTGCPCTTARGGGSILIADNSAKTARSENAKTPHKATFGFQMVCQKDANGEPVVSGQLEYQDHRPWNGKSVSFHGAVTGQAEFLGPDGKAIECPTDRQAAFSGKYTPQPESIGEAGTFTVQVEDAGKDGPSEGDTFTISLSGGIFDGYQQSGTLVGGNVKTF